MKKRVRVYKAGGQSNKLSQKQIEAYLTQKMSADDYDGDTDALKDDLAGAGIDEDVADEYIATVSDDLGLNQDTVSIEEQQRLADEQAQLAVDKEQALLKQQEAADQARQAQLAAMYNTDIDMSTTEDTPEDEANYMKQGGSKLSKRSFIKEYTKLAKMGQGGDTPSPGADDVLNGRETHVKGFLGAVKNTATEAVLKQAAEAQYGRYQNGGVQQNQPDSENITHHMNAYATGVSGIFDNPQVGTNIDFNREQFGGFTDTDSGLYKFIGGGDNESADEEYQDGDIDYNEYAEGGFKMPKRSGRQYIQAVNSPYYTSTGQAAVNPNLAGRQVTSVDVTKRGLLGRPKAYTVNYGNPNATAAGATPQIKMPTEDQAKTLDAQYAAQDKKGNRQPVADWMMRSGIPGIKQMGARMTRSGMIPEVPQGAQPTTPAATQAGDMPYYPPLTGRAQRRERRDDAQLNRFLGNKDADVFNDPKEVARIQQSNPGYVPFGDANKAQAIANQASSLTSTPAVQNVQIGPSAKSAIPTGGYVDPSVVKSLQAYTDSKAFGGDVSVPELYRAQIGTEVPFDPNANNMSISNLQGYFDKAPTKDATGNQIQATVPESMQPDNITIDPNQANNKPSTEAPDNYSQDFQVKKDRSNLSANLIGGSYLAKGFADQADQINAKKQENQMINNLKSPESIYGISNEDYRGDHDQAGNFRPDDTGFKDVSRYGGGVYAMGGNTEDEDEDIQYMTQEEIDDFMANGGELEYL